jgi:hypothetical protein
VTVRRVTEHRLAKRALRDVSGIVVRRLDPADRLAADALELFGWEGRVREALRDEVDSGLEVAGQDRRARADPVGARRGVERSAERIDDPGDLLRRFWVDSTSRTPFCSLSRSTLRLPGAPNAWGTPPSVKTSTATSAAPSLGV